MTDKKKKRVRAHAKKHGLSYQAAHNQLERRPPPQSLEFWDWVEHVGISGDCLTIADITVLSPGDRLPLLVMDRNLCDHVYPGPGEPYCPPRAPETFFDPARDGCVYTHVEGITGTVEWGWDIEKERVDDPFTFELEFKPGYWHPLEDGFIPSVHDDAGDGWKELPAKQTHWTDYPVGTKVGWRGPLMRWADIRKHPMVFTRINLDLLAAEAAFPQIQQALGIHRERMFLRRRDNAWVLIVDELTDDEETQLERRFQSITVISQAQWFRENGVIVAGKRRGSLAVPVPGTVP